MIVPGDGPTPCDIMIIGEAPGANEEEQGKPFVGTAGKILASALTSAGFSRSDVYITNIYKERPPNNRTPTADEINSHLHFLIEEFNEVDPKFVLLLGNTALSTLTGSAGISSRHGSRVIPRLGFTHSDIFFYTTYHPAATVYNRETKSDFFRDVEIFGKIVRGLY